MATDSHPQIFSDTTTTLWGWPGSIINLFSYVLRVFWQTLRTVQEWGADKKGSFCWDSCLKISSPKTRKYHCAAQMDNSANNTPKYPTSLALRACTMSQYHCTQRIPSAMCLIVEDWRRIPIPIAQLSWWTRLKPTLSNIKEGISLPFS
jgi:hypothetical protein